MIKKLLAVVFGLLTFTTQAETILIIPVGNGGVLQQYALRLQPLLSQWLNDTVIVESRPGGNGAVAATHLSRARGTMFLLGSWQKDSPVDQISDIVPVLDLGTLNQVIFTYPGSGVDLTIAPSSKPPVFNYGMINGAGMRPYVQGFANSVANRMILQEVLYKSAADMIRDVAGKHIELGSVAYTAVGTLIQSGKLVPLAVTGPDRSPNLPGVKTIRELGYQFPEDWIHHNTILWASPETDPATIAMIRKNFTAWMHSTEAQEIFRTLDHKVSTSAATNPKAYLQRMMQR